MTTRHCTRNCLGGKELSDIRDKLTIRTVKGRSEKLKRIAKRKGMTVNGLLNYEIDKLIEREEKKLKAN